MVDQEPENADFKNGLAISFYKLGQLHQKQNDLSLARSYFQEAEAHLVVLAEQFPAYVQFEKYLGIVRRVLDKL